MSPPNEPASATTTTCSECGAINPGSLPFCAECGTSLDPLDGAGGGETATRLRHEASHTLERAYVRINAITLTYRLGAAAYAVATLFAVLALARTDVPVGPGIVVVALTSSLAVVMLAAALLLLFRPYLCTVTVATLATAVTVVHVVGPNPYGLAFLGSLAWALVTWGLLVPSRRFQALIDHHRDLYVLHHAGASTRRALKGKSAEQRHARLVRAMRKAARRTWRLSAAIAAAFVASSALGTLVVVASVRPDVLEPKLERFRDAWATGDLDALGELYAPSVREVELARLRGRLAGHGWSAAPPPLGEPATDADDGRVQLAFTVDAHPVRAEWLRDGTLWWLVRVELPLPSFAPALEEFEQAWRASDTPGVAAHFAEDARARMLGLIEDAVVERGWETFPAILERRIWDDGGEDVTVSFTVQGGKVVTEWHYRVEGVWRIHRLRFPRR